MTTIDERIAALGVSATDHDVVKLAKEIGEAGSGRRRKLISALSDPSRTEDDRRSVEPLVELTSLIEGFGVDEVLAAIERSGKRRRRSRGRK
jgi:hypothetical protein